MRNQGKGPVLTLNQHCCSKLPHHWSNPRGHAHHRFDTRPEGIPKVTLPPQHTPEEATSFHLAITKEEEEKEEEVLEVFDSKDEFDVFNQTLSPEASPGDLGSSSLTQSSHI